MKTGRRTGKLVTTFMSRFTVRRLALISRKSIFPKSDDSPDDETFYFYKYRILAHLEN